MNGVYSNFLQVSCLTVSLRYPSRVHKSLNLQEAILRNGLTGCEENRMALCSFLTIQTIRRQHIDSHTDPRAHLLIQ